jgi:hypothetical protein
MIRHIVIWRLKDEAKCFGWVERLESIHLVVAAMRERVPELLRIELGVNKAQVADSADLLLLSEFRSWEALHGYEKHPLHDELRRLIVPVRLERRVLDYEV